ncbi:HAD-IIB family hydrolase [Bacillus norwichensis]|uniref:HAD family phosphatase n=1 Tax=Bacillus norwichensis TaxID=2762217 RepID=A0ABR8VPN5_9BACI|nr:HAD-IIB family hydrolase [Bacillus norwichensis]MBD8006735.1 HAD family phosphatase [Bacillus norwichensis]
MKFVFDLDGTICFRGIPVSDKILDKLEQLVELGHEVLFASARPIRDLLPVLHERCHHYSMVGGNGAIVASQGKIISTTGFDETTLSKLITLINMYDVTYLIDGSWNYAYTGTTEHSIIRNLDPHKLAKNVTLGELHPIIKVLMLTSNNMEKVKQDLDALDVVVNVHSNERVLDISPKGINKWTGLQQLGVTDGEYVAFGNDANDITMFQHAKHSIMIGENPQLSPFSKEALPLNDYIEDTIIEKLKELGNLYLPSARNLVT